MKSFFIKNRKSFIALSRNLFILCLILILLKTLTALSIEKYINFYIINFIIILSIFSYFFFYFLETLILKEAIIKITNITFITLLLITYIINLPFLNQAQEKNLFLDSINNPYIVFITILIGLLNFYFISQKQNLLRITNSQQKIKTIPHDINWAPFIIAVFLVVIVSSVFYFNNAGNYGFQGDEYYHAQVTKNFFDGKELFKIDDEKFYTRSKITSLLPITSKYLFTLFNIEATDEFVYRFPIISISLLSMLIIYLIIRQFASTTISLLATLIISLDPWFIYFGKFLRFYSPTLFFQLLLLLVLIKSKNEQVKYWILLISIILFFFLQTYFVLLIGFVSLLIIIRKIKEKKYFKLLIICLLALSFLIIEILLMIKNTTARGYSEITIYPNLKNIGTQLNWMITNYSLFFITFLSSLPIFFRNKIYNYTLLSLGFFILYINNTDFNFTFRPIYFFLPLIIIFSILSITILIKNKKVKYSIFTFLIFTNIFYYIQYPANKNESCFYPTKLIYEKSPCISSEKELSSFIKEYVKNNNFNINNIYFLGMGNFKYYFDIKEENILNYANKNGKFSNYQDIIDFNKGEELIFITSSSALPIENNLQQLFFNRDYASEVSTSISEVLEQKNNSHKLFETPKKHSKIFLISN